MLTLDDIAALESLWADANQDTPWQTFEAKDGSEDFIHLCDDDGAPLAWLPADDAGRCNGALIARAVNALPGLLALARRALQSPDSPPSEPGAHPLDTPVAREALRNALDEFRLWGGPDMVPLILAALAPYVAALQRAAFRAGVEAAAAEAEHLAGLRGAAIFARVLRTPAGFAAPGPGVLEALRPFAEIGQWLFARDLPDDTPLVEAGGINGYAVMLTRGHFKAAHRALREAEASAAEVPHG